MNVTTNSMTRIALAVAFVVGASGTAFADNTVSPHNDNMADEKSDQPVSDTWITTKVKADLAATEGVSGTDISVETTNGVVTLVGVVATKMEHDKAIAVTKGIKGVTSVDSAGLKVK